VLMLSDEVETALTAPAVPKSNPLKLPTVSDEVTLRDAIAALVIAAFVIAAFVVVEFVAINLVVVAFVAEKFVLIEFVVSKFN